MNLRHTFLASFAAALALLSCAHPTAVRRDGKTYWTRKSAQRVDVPPPTFTPPPWARSLPVVAGTRFYLGEYEGIVSDEEAMARAWGGALVRIGLAEFPELASARVESRERLDGATYERFFAMRLDQVDWRGLREATEYGSPYVHWDSERGTHRVLRLLAWNDNARAAAKAALFAKDGKRRPPPMPPEAIRREEVRMAEAAARVELLNEKLKRRAVSLERVFGKLTCGTTVGDIIAILGSPDRFNPMNSRLFEKEYYWGPFRLLRHGSDPRVVSVLREGDRSERILCSKRSVATNSQ